MCGLGETNSVGTERQCAVLSSAEEQGHRRAPVEWGAVTHADGQRRHATEEACAACLSSQSTTPAQCHVFKQAYAGVEKCEWEVREKGSLGQSVQMLPEIKQLL